MRTIYLDVLLIFSLYMNYLLLQLTARLTHTHLKFSRALLGAGAGSFSSLLILAPTMPFLLSIVCKMGVAFLICWIAFGRKHQFLWKCFCFLGISCLMAGGLFALSFSGRICYLNGIWYPDISLKVLIIGTISAYLLLSIIQRFHDRTPDDNYFVSVRYGVHTIRLDGLADTGNTLTDFLTGQPVIICGKEPLHEMLPATLPAKGFRPLPCTTVAGEGMLMVFHPDEIVIHSEKTGLTKKVDALIGLSEQNHRQAIFNPKLLHY
ncbi:MAG: sigma-E processing peptidase SpoIIGA [Oscillospiraceae bacterium]